MNAPTPSDPRPDPAADLGGQTSTVDAGIARRVEQRARTPDDPADVAGRKPSGELPADADDSVLESLGKAVSRPVTDAAAAEDPALPRPAAPER